MVYPLMSLQQVFLEPANKPGRIAARTGKRRRDPLANPEEQEKRTQCRK